MKWKITDSSDVAILFIALGQWILGCECGCRARENFRNAITDFSHSTEQNQQII